MAAKPGRRARRSASKISLTRPISRTQRRRCPSDETIPADSCPRCCRACNPRYARFEASGWPKMPMTPHMRGPKVARCRDNRRWIVTSISPEMQTRPAVTFVIPRARYVVESTFTGLATLCSLFAGPSGLLCHCRDGSRWSRNRACWSSRDCCGSRRSRRCCGKCNLGRRCQPRWSFRCGSCNRCSRAALVCQGACARRPLNVHVTHFDAAAVCSTCFDAHRRRRN